MRWGLSRRQSKGLRKEGVGVERLKLVEVGSGTGCLEEGLEGQLLVPEHAVIIMKSKVTVWCWRA